MMVGHWSLRGYGLWAAEERSSGVLVGRIGFWNPEGWPGFELGWMLRRSFWGQGYATRRGADGSAVCLHAAGSAAGHQPDPPGERRLDPVARRLGQRLLGPTEVMGRPALVYRITREEWECRTSDQPTPVLRPPGHAGGRSRGPGLSTEGLRALRGQSTPAGFEDTVLTPETGGEHSPRWPCLSRRLPAARSSGRSRAAWLATGRVTLRGVAVRPNCQGSTRGQGFRVSGRVNDLFGMELFEYDKALGSTAMEPTRNDLGQPIGFPLPGWAPPPAPPREPMEGRFCRLEPLDPDRHAADLFAADAADADGRSWTYLAYGPFRTLSDYRTWMCATCLGADPLFFAIVASPEGKAVGVASYLRITRPPVRSRWVTSTTPRACSGARPPPRRCTC